MNCKTVIVALLIAASFSANSPAIAATGHVQMELSFKITLHATADVAALAFGAVAEQGWDPDWHPTFVFPKEPKDRAGAVFAVGAQTWLLQTWDMHNHSIRYIAFDPNIKVTQISIVVSPMGAGRSQAEITYQRTGLSTTGDQQIRNWAKQFPTEGPEWAAAINHYLSRSNP